MNCMAIQNAQHRARRIGTTVSVTSSRAWRARFEPQQIQTTSRPGNTTPLARQMHTCASSFHLTVLHAGKSFVLADVTANNARQARDHDADGVAAVQRT